MDVPSPTFGVHGSPANSTPTFAINHPFDHPPYAEMITAAIDHLKENDGSSRIAIDKYIESTYTNLPPAHPELLDSHLKRLMNSGVIKMVKDSYMLAESKSTLKRGRGRPSKIAQIRNPNVDANPTLAALGLMDDLKGSLTKRGRGRPPKSNEDLSKGKPLSVKSMDSPSPKAKEGSSDGVESDEKSTDLLVKKKGRGRPPNVKVDSLAMEVSGGQSMDSLSPLDKGGFEPQSKSREESPEEEESGDDDESLDSRLPIRKRGLPPKVKKESSKVEESSEDRSMDSSPPVTTRKRGRPSKTGSSANDKFKKLSGRPQKQKNPPGRPRKVVMQDSDLGEVTVQALSSRQPGRSSREERSAGLPRKLPQSAAPSDPIMVLEHFQSKIKEAVSVLMLHLTDEKVITAAKALRELEKLAVMDLNAPLPVEE